MHFFRMSLFCLLVIPFPGVANAQDDQSEQIQDRLEEVQNMIDEEQSTIAVLESQLKEALNDNDTERVEKLRAEIDAAYESLEKLKELNDQLRELRDSAEEDNNVRVRGGAQPRLPRGKRRVPNPRIGGSEGAVDWEAERRRRERKREQQRRDRGQDVGGPEGMAPRGNRGRSSNRGESARLRNLRAAFDALVDAGEMDMADDVQDLIDAEARKQDRNDRSKDQGRDRDRGNRGDFGGRGRGDGPAMADGPASADGNSGRSRTRSRGNARDNTRDRNRSRDRDRDRDTDEDIDDLEDEIDRLRDKLRDLKDDRKDDG